ncbi:MAG TPA: signal peptide peptidase SppA [Burkholderiaceae bacterium]|nr:signal peptide peptidase SppA [Burkholderiaceae bacterium]
MSTPEDNSPPPYEPVPPPIPPQPEPPQPVPPLQQTVAVPPAGDTLAEQFARAYLMDRRSERRWRVFFRLSWLLLVIAIAYGVFAARTKTAAPSGPHTALIEVRGEIAEGVEASAENLVSGIKSAFEDNGAQAIVLRINSPGGSPVQAGIVNDEIRRLKKLHNKKVYAVVEETCASGAYYIAVAADEIYVDKASIVGSIGVLMDSFGATGLMEKLGVERRLLTAGENKGIGDPFSPLAPKQRAYIQAMLDQIHHQFIQVVRDGRGKRLKETPEMFSGLFWNGEQALQLGLADHLGNLDYVAREVVKAEEVVDYTPKENVAERLAKRFGAAIGAGAVKALQSSLTTLR